MPLSAKHVAILIAPRGTEDPEFQQPKAALEQAGVQVTVISLEAKDAQTNNHDLDPGTAVKVDQAIAGADAGAFDAVVVPGGTVGADKLRSSKEVVAFVGAFLDAGKPVAAICHAPWVLIETGKLDGRTLTSYPTLQTDVRNAGATWVDQEVVTDRGVITSRNPNDLPAFNQALLEALGD